MVKCATEATSSHSTVLVEPYSTSSGDRIEFERAGVCRLRADTSAKTKSGTRGVKVSMGFEQDTAGAAEAQPARPGNVPVLPCA